ncbi:DUF5999 family protein [Streptomyces chartreusis]
MFRRPYAPRRLRLLCHGLLVFDGTGELLSDGQIVSPHRPIGALEGALLFRQADARLLLEGPSRSGKPRHAGCHEAAVARSCTALQPG